MSDFALFQVGVELPTWIWFQNVVIPVLGMGLGGFVMFGVYRTVNRFLDRRHERLVAATQAGSSPELEELKDRVEALEDTAFRLQDLEERLDFAERLLTREQRQLGANDRR
ncbi:MAG: hypothetical protein JSW71_02025 [Gemmatimonadota bacterium]|nr:MAG: hypothetical protein JSW71_02025 [Gemmatimonadota bacterium]